MSRPISVGKRDFFGIWTINMANFPSSYILQSFVCAKVSNLKSNCVCLVIPVLWSQYSLSCQQQFRYSKNKMVINLCSVPLCPKISGIKQRYSEILKPQYLSACVLQQQWWSWFGLKSQVFTKRGDFCNFQTSLSLFLHQHCIITEHSCLISGMLRSHSSTMPWMCCRAEGAQGPAPSPEWLPSLRAELPGDLWSSANTKCNWFSSLSSMTGVTFPELDKGGPDVHDRFLHKHFTFFCFSSCLLFFSGLKKSFSYTLVEITALKKDLHQPLAFNSLLDLWSLVGKTDKIRQTGKTVGQLFMWILGHFFFQTS